MCRGGDPSSTAWFVSELVRGRICSDIGDEDLSHMSNWFECMRSGNTKTNATVDNGFLHAVAVIMAAQSYWRGKRLHRFLDHRRMRGQSPPDGVRSMSSRSSDSSRDCC